MNSRLTRLVGDVAHRREHRLSARSAQQILARAAVLVACRPRRPQHCGIRQLTGGAVGVGAVHADAHVLQAFRKAAAVAVALRVVLAAVARHEYGDGGRWK